MPRLGKPLLVCLLLGHSLELDLGNGAGITHTVALYGLRTSRLIQVAVTEEGRIDISNEGASTDIGLEEQVKAGFEWLNGFLSIRLAGRRMEPDPGPPRLRDTPVVKARLGLSTAWRQFTLSAFSLYSSEVHHEVLALEDPSRTELHRIEPWGIVNLNLQAHQLSLPPLRVTVGVHVENLFDTTYFTPIPVSPFVAQLLAPGRRARASLLVEY